jgi:hypothetical protein
VDQKGESWSGFPPGVTISTLVERITNLSRQVEALRVGEERRHTELRVEMKDRFATKAELSELKAAVAIRLLVTIVGAILAVGVGVATMLVT